MWNKCENRYGEIIRPGCYDGRAERFVTVIYGPEADSFYLCDRCYNTLRRDVRRHGYKIRSRALRR